MGLTKYPEGSIRELWNLSFPLMISGFSVLAMIFVDRLLLAHYSIEALSSAVNAATFGWAFIFFSMGMGNITEVFVSQYNGAREYFKLGRPVWQMLWFSLITLLFFLPLSLWGGDFFYGFSEEHTLKKDYFKWMLLFGPTYAMYAALCGFFIGQGKTKLITILAIFANCLNAFLDIILIFGINGLIEPMGVKGAAIATSVGNVFQTLVLGTIFLNKNNRIKFNTDNYSFDFQLFKNCLKIGLPNALFSFFELLGWAAFYWMMTKASDRHITIASICQSMVILFFFIGDGVAKAATAIAGNFIGARKSELISKVLFAGIKLHLFFFCLLLCFLFFAKDLIIKMFLPNTSPETIDLLRDSLVISLFGIFVHLFFEWIRILIAGVLTAAGDTLFLLVSGALIMWFFVVVPVYYFIIQMNGSVEIGILVCCIYSLAGLLVTLLRYYSGKWKGINIREEYVN